MRLLVAIKRVIDYNARVRVKADKVRVQQLASWVTGPLLPG